MTDIECDPRIVSVTPENLTQAPRVEQTDLYGLDQAIQKIRSTRNLNLVILTTKWIGNHAWHSDSVALVSLAHASLLKLLDDNGVKTHAHLLELLARPRTPDRRDDEPVGSLRILDEVTC